ncbi:MAG: amidase, partial [Phenylobacterium sp.]|nr:amidase [Phenylobacterium sp.]
MTPEEYAALDGLGLAEAIRKGRTTPLEAVDAAIAIIERRNPVLNAVVHTAFEEARRQALGDLPDGPFRGVPFLIKDLAMPVAGWPRTSGSRFARHIVDRQDGG